MGNSISGPAATRTGGALDSFVSELGADVTCERSLGSARFLKNAKGKHQNGPLVIKIFIKPDPGLSLRNYHKRLHSERDSLGDIPNVYNYQTFLETDRAGYIIRQWLFSSLYDRISTRPFLSHIEKKWIAFQLIYGLRDARNRKVPHGDIKSENILVTSWNWVYITDFASSIKPTYLPLDDPADFSFFFDTSGRRTCYLAPERFYTAGSEISKLKADLDFHKRDGIVTEAMDVFSAGCVVAELFLDGAPTFTLSQLFKYRQGELNIEQHLAGIQDAGIRSLILSMISLDPTVRPTFESLLHSSRGSTFPEPFYSFLHNYISSINEPSSPSLFSKSPIPSPNIDSLLSAGPQETLPSDSDSRLERIWRDFETMEVYLVPEGEDGTVLGRKFEYTPVGNDAFQDVLPVNLNVPNRSLRPQAPGTTRHIAASEDGPALIILSLICANIRGSHLPSSKSRALDLLLAVSFHLTDEAKLDRSVPYAVDLLQDESAVVRASALRTLVQVLMLVSTITPSNISIFSDYILPSIRHLARDPDVSVRSMFAQCLVPLADTSLRYLEISQAMKAHGTFITPDFQGYEEGRYEVSYDVSLQDLQVVIQDLLVVLLVDPSSVVKRAVLHNISSLCIFLGRQKTNDVLLSHMITYLNDADWLLRYAFFESIVDVAACVGSRSLEEYILPLMIQAFSDVEESVVAKVLGALTSLCELGLFAQMRIWELMSATIGFLYHPNSWIRQGAASFLGAATKRLSSTDVWCILYPSLRSRLRADIREIDQQSLLTFAKPPLSRQIFDSAISWAMKSGKSSFWRGAQNRTRTSSKAESAKEMLVAARKPGHATPRGTSMRSDEDDAQLQRLRLLGMTAIEETKLLILRDYILKLAGTNASFSSRSRLSKDTNALTAAGVVKLQALQVVPQTVFLAPKSGNTSRSDSHRRSTLESPSGMGQMNKRSPLAHPSSRHTPATSSDRAKDGNLDDLRRRLGSTNGSTTSIHNAGIRERRGSVSSLQSTAQSPTFPPFDFRPSSPANSGTEIAVTRRKLIHVGSTDGQKGLPAIASIRANAMGLLEPPTALRSVSEEHIPSGRSSPVSQADTFRGERRIRLQSQFVTTYAEGHDVGIASFIENVYNDAFRDPSQDFGPRVHDGPVRRRTTMRHGFTSRENSQRRNDVTLVAHLSSHSAAINGLAVSPDHLFFVSCSDDKTVKVWDTARLERNVTGKPRHTYSQHHARVTAVCILEASHCFASAADDGSLHVVRVHVSQTNNLPKYSKLQVVREHRVDQPGEFITCLTHYNNDLASNLIYATSHSRIVHYDLRTRRVVRRMENPRHHGPVSCMCLDRQRTWLVVGTLSGALNLWDLRFGILLKSWRTISSGQSQRTAQVHKCVVHPTVSNWILVSTETQPSLSEEGTVLVQVWDIEKTVLVESFVTTDQLPSKQTPLSSPGVGSMVTEGETSPAAAIASLVRSRTSKVDFGHIQEGMNDSSDPPRIWTQPDVRALVAGRDFGGHILSARNAPGTSEATIGEGPGRKVDRGFIVTGSEDRKIRVWFLGAIDQSFLVSGAELEADKPIYRFAKSTDHGTYLETVSLRNGTKSSRSQLITQHQQNLVKSHQDCITALLCVDSPFRGGLVSGDRAGILKVYRIEGD